MSRGLTLEKIGRIVYGGNSGYRGYSKSVRAVNAEENGLRNVSQMDLDFLAEVNEMLDNPTTLSQIKKEIRYGHIKPDEWHHTSMYGNKTNYYSAATIAEYFQTPDEYDRRQDERIANQIKKQQLEQQEREEREREIERLLQQLINNLQDSELYQDGFLFWPSDKGGVYKFDLSTTCIGQKIDGSYRVFGISGRYFRADGSEAHGEIRNDKVKDAVINYLNEFLY